MANILRWSMSGLLRGYRCAVFRPKISGYWTPGTFQEYVLGPANYVTPIPESRLRTGCAIAVCGCHKLCGLETDASQKRTVDCDIWRRWRIRPHRGSVSKGHGTSHH
jgi:hypothetical protein